MSDHRQTEERVSNEVGTKNLGSFDPGEALQSLYGEIVQLEAFTHAASEAMAQLPLPKDREARRPFERAYTLIARAADDTNAAVRYGGELMDALGVYLKEERAAEVATPEKSD